MIIPDFLERGDNVGLIAPAYQFDPAMLEPFLALLSSWGLQTVQGDNLLSRDCKFAGTDSQRLADFVKMMSDPHIKAVFCARGGYGCERLLVDIDRYLASFIPKWLIGYSDITALASFMVNRMNCRTIHGPMPIDLSKKQTEDGQRSWDYLRHLLFGQLPSYSITSHHWNRNGEATAHVVGGNLSVMFALNATDFQWQTQENILFIEDVGEKLHHLDRMMTNLRISGQLGKLKGLIVGDMTEMEDANPYFGKTAYEIIAEHVSDYQFPVAYKFPAGHGGANYPIILGATASLKVADSSVTVDFK